jgi:hypothetical protein
MDSRRGILQSLFHRLDAQVALPIAAEGPEGIAVQLPLRDNTHH